MWSCLPCWDIFGMRFIYTHYNLLYLYVSMQCMKPPLTKSALWRKRHHKCCDQSTFGTHFHALCPMEQKMRFDELCRNDNMCIVKEDNSIFIVKAFSHFSRRNICMRKQLHILCYMRFHKALYGNVLYDLSPLLLDKAGS